MYQLSSNLLRTAFLGVCLWFVSPASSSAQEVDISSQLKLIDSCNIEKATADLQILKHEHPKDPAVIYLDALLTKDAEDALAKYTLAADKYPGSKYADAALFRIYSYYNSQGLYAKARSIADKLRQAYPQSQYLKLTEKRNAPVQVSGIDSAPGSQEKTGGFTIQAGAFLNAENARKLKETLQAEGYPASVKVKQVAGSALSVVNAGAFKTEDEARSALTLINNKFRLNGRVVPADN